MEQTNPSPQDMGPMYTDDVIRLRQWASDQTYPLPEKPEYKGTLHQSWLIGAAPDCHLQIHDPKGQISRHHARLMREVSEKWFLLDLPSRNGLIADGVRQTAVVLEPGLELQLGSITMVAESLRLILLRDYLLRLMGWNKEAVRKVERALRAIRIAHARHMPLTLQGEGYLPSLAQSLHRRIWGDSRPFVLFDPSRDTAKESVRSLTNFQHVSEALVAAYGGTLCAEVTQFSPELVELHNEQCEPGSKVHLILFDTAWLRSSLSEARGMTVTIPPLSSRRKDMEEIVSQYFVEAQGDLKIRCAPMHEDIEWILENSADSFYEIEKGTRRVTALLGTRTLSAAARALGMTNVSLRRWLRLRAPRYRIEPVPPAHQES
jgi:Inner membrane component of T3SS, cytoplasmic domain